MTIVFDHYVDPVTGVVFGNQSIDTSDPAVQAMLTAAKVSAAAQTTAGYSVMSNHPSYPGKTRWQVILAEVVRLNDAAARGILGV
jgi:hypothetical protein